MEYHSRVVFNFVLFVTKIFACDPRLNQATNFNAEGAISYFREDDEGGRARVTMDEERVLRKR